MKRGETGRYEVTVAGGEKVQAFIPSPLPPDPPVDFSGLQTPLEKAHLALGRLDALSTVLPDPDLFLYSYVRKEAVLSSQIEGTQSSFSDLLLFELEDAPGVPLDEVVEVSNYVAALDHGLKRLREGFPLSNRLLREIHARLLARGRGSEKSPGEFRRSQNWIAGSRPGNARFVPPPPHVLLDCLSEFEKFLHGRGLELPALIRAALAHVQFETIHPFLDGNGRVGRLLITLLLFHDGVLREPLLYLSFFFKQHRDQYYALLDVVRKEGDWERWLHFFLDGVVETAEGACSTARKVESLFQEDHAKIQALGRQASSALRVQQALRERPIATLKSLSQRTGLSYPAVSTGMRALEGLRIAREMTGKSRNRIFCYDRYLALLNEGTELE